MKHLKKDDGYVLIYVLIVFTVLSLVAASICAMALNNLKAQKADVARMEARYEAEGELQKFVAEVEALKTTSSVVDEAVDVAKTDAEVAFWNEVCNFENVDLVEDTNRIQITVEAEKTGYIATIFAEAKLTVQAMVADDMSQATCTLQDWEYTFHDISYEEVSE